MKKYILTLIVAGALATPSWANPVRAALRIATFPVRAAAAVVGAAVHPACAVRVKQVVAVERVVAVKQVVVKEVVAVERVQVAAVVVPLVQVTEIRAAVVSPLYAYGYGAPLAYAPPSADTQRLDRLEKGFAQLADTQAQMGQLLQRLTAPPK